MKLLKKNEKLLKVCLITFISGIIFTGKVFGANFEAELSNEYQEWNKLSEEEKLTGIMPNPTSVDVPNSILSKYQSIEIPNLVGSIMQTKEASLVDVSSASDAKFSLKDKLNIRVENQGITNECWAFSVIKSMETNIALKNGVTELKDFSERHMDYSSIKTFNDGTNPKALKREAGDGGLPIMGLAYLTNGQGAVLEEDLKFENNVNKISLNDLDKEVNTIVTDYEMLPQIAKSYTKDSAGNTVSVKYTDSNGNTYSKEEVNAIRKILKEYIVENGGITSFTAGSKSKFYNGTSIFESTAYNCNDTSVIRDHAITIVGWDDNYSKDNFKNGTKPSTDGAYIVLNSYGDKNFDNGYIYISYEDFFIESELYGISSTSEVDYTKIYQYDDFGGILKLGTQGSEIGYIGATYTRDSSKKEILNSVGVTVSDYTNVEIFVNPNGNSLELNDLVSVGKSNTLLEPGYHRIDITPTELKSDNFAIVIKQTAEEGEHFSFEIEVKVDSTAYENVTSENKSYISMNGTEWINLKDLNVGGVEMNTADVCIKGFTTEKATEEPEKPENPDTPDTPTTEDKFTSNLYKIDDNYIMNITHSTTKEKLISNIETNLKTTILNEDSSEITNNSEIIKTGYKIKLSNNKEYTLIVRGDVNCDGKLTLTDVSKIVLFYNGNKGYELTGAAEKSADMNLDGKFTLTDVSQLVELYNSLI